MRDDLGKAFYHALYRGYFTRDWNDLPDHDRERLKIAATEFLASESVAEFIERLRSRVAA